MYKTHEFRLKNKIAKSCFILISECWLSDKYIREKVDIIFILLLLVNTKMLINNKTKRSCLTLFERNFVMLCLEFYFDVCYRSPKYRTRIVLTNKYIVIKLWIST